VNETREAIRNITESKMNIRRHYESLVQQQQPENGQCDSPLVAFKNLHDSHLTLDTQQNATIFGYTLSSLTPRQLTS
jgi:hypothetical protein